MLHIGDNLAAFERGLSDAMQEQLPFATALALNDTARDVVEAWQAAAPQIFDRPTPFTERGFAILRRARKRSLTTIPGIRRIQAEYLRLQVTGGTRVPEGQALLVPKGARRNRYGNLPRHYVRTLLRSGQAFVASQDDPRTRHLPPGLYRRRKLRGRAQPPELMVAFVDQATYAPRFDLEGIARQAALPAFPRHLSRRLIEAWGTRR